VAELAEIVFDSLHPARLARFWTAALEGFEVRGYDDAEIDRLTALGRTPELLILLRILQIIPGFPGRLREKRLFEADRSGHYRIIRGPRDLVALHRELRSMEEGEPA